MLVVDKLEIGNCQAECSLQTIWLLDPSWARATNWGEIQLFGEREEKEKGVLGMNHSLFGAEAQHGFFLARHSQGHYLGSPHVFEAGISFMTWGSFLLIVQENIVKILARAEVKMVCNWEENVDFSGARKKNWPEPECRGFKVTLKILFLLGSVLALCPCIFPSVFTNEANVPKGAYFSFPDICSRISW